MSSSEEKENLLSFHLHRFSCRNKPLSPFISKLRFLLSCCKHQHAIHWSNDGRAIVITDVDVFKKSVLHNQAEMFKTRNFTSFVRQLNLYGFRKVPSTGKSEAGVNMRFEHAHFRRDRPDLMQFVQRSCFSTGKKKIADSMTSIASSTSNETRLIPKETTTTITPTILKVRNDNINIPTVVSRPCARSQSSIGPLILKSLKTNNGRFPVSMRPPYQTVFAPSKHHLLSTATTTTTTLESVKVISLSHLLKNALPETIASINKESQSSEHNYALLPITSSDKMLNTSLKPSMTSFPPPTFELNQDKDVYQFLNENFSAEKEVVQSLLSLPTSQPDQNFDDLKTLAEVSSNNVHLNFNEDFEMC